MENGIFYITRDGNPFFNMALDEWLFEKMRTGRSCCHAYLRLYTWGKEAITIGYNQDPDRAVEAKKLDKRLPVIRRITGGRAIYHDKSELTMTLVLNISVLPPKLRSLKEINRLVSEAIVEIFGKVGIVADWARQSGRRFMNSQKDVRRACFDSAARFEIVSGNRKIVAGAQRRIGDSLIHQGSLKVNGITHCPAINQIALATSGRSDSENDKGDVPYVISDFSGIFPDIFSKRLRVKFENDHLIEDELEDIEKYIVILMEKVLARR